MNVPPPLLDSVPLAGEASVTVRVSTAPALGSAIVAAANGVAVALEAVLVAPMIPPIVIACGVGGGGAVALAMRLMESPLLVVGLTKKLFPVKSPVRWRVSTVVVPFASTSVPVNWVKVAVVTGCARMMLSPVWKPVMVALMA